MSRFDDPTTHLFDPRWLRGRDACFTCQHPKREHPVVVYTPVKFNGNISHYLDVTVDGVPVGRIVRGGNGGFYPDLGPGNGGHRLIVKTRREAVNWLVDPDDPRKVRN